MLDILLAGLINGNAYALVALGLSLVIGVANVVNFAHGSLFAVGAMVGWFVTSDLGLPLGVGVAAAVVVTAALGWLINRVAVRPFAGKAPIAAVLSTIAVMIVLDNLTQRVFGPQTRRFDTGLPGTTWQVGGLTVGLVDVIILVTGVVLMTVLALFLARTSLGRAIRATSQDREAAAQMGVPVDRVQSVAFMIASALGGLAGVLVAAYFTTIAPTQGFAVGLAGIAAATLGGLGSLPGAVLGGLLLGVLEAFGVARWGDSVRQLITFGVLLLVLWVRPSGLLGRASIRREPLTGTFFAQGRPIRMRRWQVAVLVVLGALPVLPGLVDGYAVQVGTQVIAFAIVALSLVVVGGAAGQLSLGQAGSVAVGAYTAALLTKELGWSFVPAMLAAGLVSAVVVTVLAAPGWRLSGHYPAIATLASGAALVALALVWTPLTGGGSGIAAIPLPSVLGVELMTGPQLYGLGLALLLLVLLLVHRLLGSHLGRTWRAVRDDEVAARAAGVATPQYKSLAFGVGGFVAGVGGAYWAAQYGYIDPQIFSPNLSFQFVIIAVLGSMLSPFGAVVGSVIMVGGLEVLRAAAETRLVVYGLVLLLLIRFRPQGLWVETGLVARVRGAVSRRRAGGEGGDGGGTDGPAGGPPAPERVKETVA
ncbi:ABC transporter permease [Cellulomonas endophytica]|uniref:ABC transporter permease n=1 Tax=Cellulomonas endophytica TaxID=2494735 RepID=UPI001010BE87|nr:ABC transporter permease [Cellulomonas endophytica]